MYSLQGRFCYIMQLLQIKNPPNPKLQILEARLLVKIGCQNVLAEDCQNSKLWITIYLNSHLGLDSDSGS